MRRVEDFGGSGSPHISLRLNDRAGSPFCCSSCRSFERLKFLLFCRSVGVSVATARSCAAACGLRVWSIFVDAELCVRDVEHTRVARVVCFALSHKSEVCTRFVLPTHAPRLPLWYGMSGVCDLFRRSSNCFIIPIKTVQSRARESRPTPSLDQENDVAAPLPPHEKSYKPCAWFCARLEI